MKTKRLYTYVSSPLGPLFVQGEDLFLTGLYMPDHKGWTGPAAGCERSDSTFKEVREQLEQFFAGARRAFDVPLKLIGTPFQQRVWRELAKISCGETITYAELARRIGQPGAS